MRCSGRSGSGKTWSRRSKEEETVRAPKPGPSLCIEGVDALVGGYSLARQAIGDRHKVVEGDILGAALDDRAQAADIEDDGLRAGLSPRQLAVKRPPLAAHVSGRCAGLEQADVLGEPTLNCDAGVGGPLLEDQDDSSASARDGVPVGQDIDAAIISRDGLREVAG